MCKALICEERWNFKESLYVLQDWKWILYKLVAIQHQNILLILRIDFSSSNYYHSPFHSILSAYSKFPNSCCS